MYDFSTEWVQTGITVGVMCHQRRASMVTSVLTSLRALRTVRMCVMPAASSPPAPAETVSQEPRQTPSQT